jgi:TRAP-type C4-dicarboxylate transport system permease small subunit
MGNWPALLLAPTLALANLAITYALTTPACSRQSQLWPNLVAALILLVCLIFTAGAWRNWVGQGAGNDMPEDAAPGRARFIALVAGMVGALSCLAVLAQWFPQWILSPCAN